MRLYGSPAKNIAQLDFDQGQWPFSFYALFVSKGGELMTPPEKVAVMIGGAYVRAPA
jgi:hypothetical protein